MYGPYDCTCDSAILYQVYFLDDYLLVSHTEVTQSNIIPLHAVLQAAIVFRLVVIIACPRDAYTQSDW